MNFKSIDEWVKDYGTSLDIISKPAQTSYPLPNTIYNVQDLFSNILIDNFRKMSSRLFNAQITDVYVNTGRVMNKNYEINDFKDCNETAYVTFYNTSINLKNGIHLASHWGGINYWHWMVSSLSRLSLLNNIPKDVTYIVNSLDNNFVSGSLKAMGIDPSQCIEIDRVGCVHCDNLILPSLMTDYNQRGLLFLRNKLRKPSTNTPSRIYISRRNSRIVENEEEVMDLLKTYGFELIRCEDLSFEDQVKTFSNAEVVISPHGAGLTNLLFVKDNAKVLELRSPHYFGKCYYYLSNHLGLKYYSLYGEGELPKTKEEASAGLYSNMRINIDRLQQTLDFMGVERNKEQTSS